MNDPRQTMYVITSLDGGGAERLLTNVVLQQYEPDQLQVVTVRPGGVFRRALEDGGIKVVDLGIARERHAASGLFRLARLIREAKPQIVHGWDLSTNILVSLATRLARSRSKVFWGRFGTGPERSNLRTQIAIKLSVFLSRWVEGVVYNGEEVRDHHHAIGYRERRSVVMSNSIDATAFRPADSERDAVRKQFGIAPSDIVVAVVARLDPQKDWPAVCAAVRGLEGVVMLALGNKTTELPEQTGLIRVGWVDDVRRILSGADIFLLGSAYGEGISLAVGEAMLCRLPCIVTDVGGNGRLVGDTGIVVPPRDVQAMREAIVTLARDPERRWRLGALARERAACATSADGAVRGLHSAALRGEAY